MNAAHAKAGTVKSPEVGGAVSQVVQAIKLAASGEISKARLIAETLTEEADRKAVEDGIRAAIRETKRRQMLERNRRASAQRVKPPEVSDEVRTKTRLADEAMQKANALAEADEKGNRAAIKRHRNDARRLYRAARAIAESEADKRWAEAAMQESLSLASARGELVVQEEVDGHKVTRTWRGNGLEDALHKGYLTADHGPDRTNELYTTGLRYRQAFEIAQGQTTSRGEGSGGFGPKGPQVRIVEAGALLAKMREGLSTKELRVLDAICGEGLGLFQATKRLHLGVLAGRRCLRGGLTTAADTLKAMRKIGEKIDLADDLKAAAEAVRKAGEGQ